MVFFNWQCRLPDREFILHELEPLSCSISFPNRDHEALDPDEYGVAVSQKTFHWTNRPSVGMGVDQSRHVPAHGILTQRGRLITAIAQLLSLLSDLEGRKSRNAEKQADYSVVI